MFCFAHPASFFLQANDVEKELKGDDLQPVADRMPEQDRKNDQHVVDEVHKQARSLRNEAKVICFCSFAFMLLIFVSFSGNQGKCATQGFQARLEAEGEAARGRGPQEQDQALERKKNTGNKINKRKS